MNKIIWMLLFGTASAMAQSALPTAECQWTRDRILHLKQQMDEGDKLLPTVKEYQQRRREFVEKRCDKYQYRN